VIMSNVRRITPPWLGVAGACAVGDWVGGG
jgi:hypothetical protein